MVDSSLLTSQLNDRARSILRGLVEQYIRDGQPVGSRTLSKLPGVALSPATIRNVMVDLEEIGLLTAPHTSAGRVPTDQGFRLFVDSMLEVKPLSSSEVQSLRHEIAPDLSAESLVKNASRFLSSFTHMAGVVTSPRQEVATLRQVEFLPLSGDRVLVILVVNEQDVQNRIVQLDRSYTQSELEQAANYINQHYVGEALFTISEGIRESLQSMKDDMNQHMQTMIEMAGDVIEESHQRKREEVVVAGQTNLMEFDELSDRERLKALFETFGKQRDMYHLLERCISAEGIQIFIGSESGSQLFNDCSLITAPYHQNGEVVGMLGVIGPTRMAYERVIPVVDITSKLLGAALNSKK